MDIDKMVEAVRNIAYDVHVYLGIIELKSVRALAGEHYAQTLNYLKITGYQRALLINFGSYKFESRTVIPRFTDDGRVDSRVEVEKCRTGCAPQTPREAPSSPLPLYTAKQSPMVTAFFPSPPLHG